MSDFVPIAAQAGATMADDVSTIVTDNGEISHSEQVNPAAMASSKSRVGIVAAVLGVVVINALAVSYAVWIARPVEEESSLASGLADDQTVEQSAEVEEDFPVDWYDELPEVVNEIHLPPLEVSQALYVRQCAACHGVDGRGRGPASMELIPRPRNFLSSPFRFASEGSTREHLTSDIIRTIERGVPRSAMPGFAGVLDEMEIAGLARYVLGLRDVDEWPFEAMETIGIGTRPPLTADLVTHGASLYIEMGCVSCHGETGRGDGENANGLFDFENNPVRPADFTSGLFKSGQTPEALCRTIIAGIPGTPMVAYEAALMQENDDGTVNTIDAWSLVAFIRTLAPTTPPPGIPSGARVVPSMAADEAMLTDPTHPAWLGVDPIYIRLKPLQQRPGQAAFMEIRAVRTDDAFALCLDWIDPTLNLHTNQSKGGDAAEVIFGIGDELPAPPVGAIVEMHETGGSTNIWDWSVATQYKALVGLGPKDAGAKARYYNGWFIFRPGEQMRLPGSPSAPSNPDPQALTLGVLESNAIGLGPVTPQQDNEQQVRSTALWSDGNWRVVLTRSLAPADEGDVPFDQGIPIPMALAVWDGSQRDAAAMKMVSSWHWLIIEASPDGQ